MVFHAIESVLSLLLLILLGFWLTGQKWFGPAGASVFSKYALKVAIPCYMFYNIRSTCPTRGDLAQLFAALPIPVLIILASLVLGLILAKAFRVERARRGVFLNVVTFSNAVFVGFPVVTSVLGDASLPDAMVYYMANTLLFWTLGVWLLRRYGASGEGQTAAQAVKGIFSPAILGLLAGIASILLDVPVPVFLMKPITMLKETSVPMAMIFIGSVIRTTDFRAARLGRDLALVLAMRFVAVPLCVAVLVQALPIDGLMKQVFFLLSTMPAMTQLGIMAKETDSDYHFAAVLIGLTTAVSLCAIPLFMALMSHFQLFA